MSKITSFFRQALNCSLDIHFDQIWPGRTTIFLLDKSYSMTETDWCPNRWEGCREAFNEFINQKRSMESSHRVGIISFESNAKLEYKPAPVGTHFLSLSKVVQQISPCGGTDFLNAFKLCVDIVIPKSIRSVCNTGENSILVSSDLPVLGRIIHNTTVLLITDGHGGDPLILTDWLKQCGLRIECIGVGGDPHAVDEAILKQIASIENGKPLYRFIGDKQELVRHFGAMAKTIPS